MGQWLHPSTCPILFCTTAQQWTQQTRRTERACLDNVTALAHVTQTSSCSKLETSKRTKCCLSPSFCPSIRGFNVLTSLGAEPLRQVFRCLCLALQPQEVIISVASLEILAHAHKVSDGFPSTCSWSQESVTGGPVCNAKCSHSGGESQSPPPHAHTSNIELIGYDAVTTARQNYMLSNKHDRHH